MLLLLLLLLSCAYICISMSPSSASSDPAMKRGYELPCGVIEGIEFFCLLCFSADIAVKVFLYFLYRVLWSNCSTINVLLANRYCSALYILQCTVHIAVHCTYCSALYIGTLVRSIARYCSQGTFLYFLYRVLCSICSTCTCTRSVLLANRSCTVYCTLVLQVR